MLWILVIAFFLVGGAIYSAIQKHNQIKGRELNIREDEMLRHTAHEMIKVAEKELDEAMAGGDQKEIARAQEELNANKGALQILMGKY